MGSQRVISQRHVHVHKQQLAYIVNKRKLLIQDTVSHPYLMSILNQPLPKCSLLGNFLEISARFLVCFVYSFDLKENL